MQRMQKTHTIKTFLATSALFLAAGTAFAQTTTAPTAPTAPSATAAPSAPPAGGPGHMRGDHRHHHGGGMWLKSVDTDGDGAISKAEADAVFNKIDTNHDGKLDKAELAAYHKAQWEARRTEMKAKFDAKFKEADKNGDGALTRDEMKAAFPRMAAHFDQIDVNKDGKVTQDEIQKAMAKMHRDGPKDGPKRRGPPPASAPAAN